MCEINTLNVKLTHSRMFNQSNEFEMQIIACLTRIFGSFVCFVNFYSIENVAILEETQISASGNFAVATPTLSLRFSILHSKRIYIDLFNSTRSFITGSFFPFMY